MEIGQYFNLTCDKIGCCVFFRHIHISSSIVVERMISFEIYLINEYQYNFLLIVIVFLKDMIFELFFHFLSFWIQFKTICFKISYHIFCIFSTRHMMIQNHCSLWISPKTWDKHKWLIELRSFLFQKLYFPFVDMIRRQKYNIMSIALF